MSNLASIALSGLNAATVRQAASAHNVANALTPAFRRQVVQQQSLPEGGVITSIGRAPDIGDALAEDLVDQKMAAYAFKANVLTLQTHDRMLGSLLDIQA